MAQNTAMTTGEYNGREYSVKFGRSHGEGGRVFAGKAGGFHVNFDELEVDIMDHAACVWFRLGGEIVTHFHVPQHVGRRVATEAGRHGMLRYVNDDR